MHQLSTNGVAMSMGGAEDWYTRAQERKRKNCCQRDPVDYFLCYEIL